MVRATFSLDAETVERLKQTSARLSRPQSQIVREAVRDYAERAGRRSECERLRLLSIFDELIPAIPKRPAREASAELDEIRRARRQGGRSGKRSRRY